MKGAATRRRKTTTKGETEGRGNKAAADGAARERVRREQQVDAVVDQGAERRSTAAREARS